MRTSRRQSTSKQRARGRSAKATVGLLLIGALVAVGSTSAFASVLPTGTSVTGKTGLRPSATRLRFPVSDRVAASVDVGTGNLNIAASILTLPGVTTTAPIGVNFNSLDASSGSGAASSINSPHWTWNLDGAGSLSLQPDGTTVNYTTGDGAVWPFTLSGSTYVAPAGLKALLFKNQNGSFTMKFLQTLRTIYFNAGGVAFDVIDKSGNSSGNETTIDTPSGTSNTVTSTAGPTAARTAQFSYATGSQNTTTVTQAQGTSDARSAVISYGGSHNITRFVDTATGTYIFDYNAAGLVSKITNDAGATTTITYDSSNRVVAVAQSNTTPGSAGTSTTRLTYPSSTQTLVAGPNTDQGQAVSAVPHATFTIGANALVSAETDAAGRQHQTTFTTQGLDVASSTTGQAGGGTASIASTYGYDTGTNGGLSLTSATGQSGNQGTASYGASSPSQYLPSATEVDANISGGSMSTNYTYDGFGNQLTSTGNSAMGDASTTDSTAATSTLTYNTDGSVATALAPGNGTNKTVYGYNANHQLTSVTPVTGSSLGARSYTYDGLGRLATATDGAGRTTTYGYDDEDRLQTTSFSDSTGTVTNAYNGDGTLGKQFAASGTLENRFDQRGQLIWTQNTASNVRISYTYDAAGNTTSMTNDAGTTTYTYDDAGVLTSTVYPTSSGTAAIYFATNSNGQRTDTWFNSSSSHSTWAAHQQTKYDASGRVSEVIGQVGPASSPGTKVDFTYCYNTTNSGSTCGTGTSGDSSKLQMSFNKLTNQRTVYTYDGMGRLTRVAQSGGSAGNNTYTFTYDARGNRLTATVTGTNPSSQTLTYNAANQITTSGYSYDGAGNMTASPNSTFTYNAAEQMTGAVVSNASYTYSYVGAAQNAVLSQNGNGHTYNTVHGRIDPVGNPTIAQYQVDGATAYLGQDPVTGQATTLRTSNGSTALYIYDGLGNPVGLLTDGSASAFQYKYDPYGLASLQQTAGSGAVQNPYAFKSGIQDRGTGFVKFGARWYNPTTGTWTQQDTLDNPLDLGNANRYIFGSDDPVNLADPTGRDIFDSVVHTFFTEIECEAYVLRAAYLYFPTEYIFCIPYTISGQDRFLVIVQQY